MGNLKSKLGKKNYLLEKNTVLAVGRGISQCLTK